VWIIKAQKNAKLEQVSKFARGSFDAFDIDLKRLQTIRCGILYGIRDIIFGVNKSLGNNFCFIFGELTGDFAGTGWNGGLNGWRGVEFSIEHYCRLSEKVMSSRISVFTVRSGRVKNHMAPAVNNTVKHKTAAMSKQI